ncbi:MAG: hypothetical protein FJ292_09805 [Planctomycetes bacterium]|nr:hypothetical protein [Planctomycetota bacterium]
MARSRRGADSPVTFFSFQDVMMCTIGVTIVITMLLVLQLGAAVAKVETVAAQVDPSARAELEREARTLRQRLESAAARTGDGSARATAELRQRTLAENERAENLRKRHDDLLRWVRTEAARAAADPAAVEAADLLQRREELEDRLRTDTLRRRVTYLVAEEDRLPVIIEVSGDRLVAGTTLERDAPLAIPLADPDTVAATLASWLASLPDPDRRSILFVVKPSGVAAWRALREPIAAQPSLRELPTGLDLIPEDAFTSDRFRNREGAP